MTVDSAAQHRAPSHTKENVALAAALQALHQGDPALQLRDGAVGRVRQSLAARRATARHRGLNFQLAAVGVAFVSGIALATVADRVGLLAVLGHSLVGSAAKSTASVSGASVPARSSTESVSNDEEATLILGAASALNKGDAAQALQILDRRTGKFPVGRLDREARVLRIRAHVADGQTEDALRLISELNDKEVTPALRATHLQLLVSSGRCRDAATLVRRMTDKVEEADRALLRAYHQRCGE